MSSRGTRGDKIRVGRLWKRWGFSLFLKEKENPLEGYSRVRPSIKIALKIKFGLVNLVVENGPLFNREPQNSFNTSVMWDYLLVLVTTHAMVGTI